MSRLSFNRQLITLRSPNSFSFSILFVLLGLCTLIYYFGELVDFAGWEALRWDWFYGVHDVQRLFFLVPILYAGYVFGARTVVIITVLATSIMLFRALYISPFPNPILRPAIFCIVAGVMGYLTAKMRFEFERHDRLEALLRNERDRLLGILQGMGAGVLITGPNSQIRFTNSNLVKEFGEGIGSHCYKYLHRFDEPCPQNCRLLNVINGTIERWEYNFPDGKTYDVLASPYVDSDGVICQLTIFRNTTNRKTTLDC